jgi:hypothetical protein
MGEPVELPRTLHAQLYLLAYDRKHHRFGGTTSSARWLFEFALRSAMLTDLHLTGYLADTDGKAQPIRGVRHDDPVLHEALKDAAGQNWTRWIAQGQRDVRQLVGDQLEATGWVNVQRRRTLGVLPARLGVYDDDMVGGLAYRVIEALDSIIDDKPADPRPLALGLLAFNGQLPVVSAFFENLEHRGRLREMTFAAIEPILGLHQAIQNRLAGVRFGSDAPGFCSGGCGGGV